MDKERITFNGRWYSTKLSGEQHYHIATTDPRTRLSRDMWEYCRGPLLASEIVHHINGNTLDDRMDNFAKIEWGVHSRKHLSGIKRSEETKHKISLGKSKPNPARSQNIMGKDNPNWKGGSSYRYRREEYDCNKDYIPALTNEGSHTGTL